MLFINIKIKHLASNIGNGNRYFSVNKKIPAMVNRCLTISFLSQLDLFNKDGFFPKGKKGKKTIFVNMDRSSLHPNSIIGGVEKDFVQKAHDICGPDLTLFAQLCDGSSRTRKEFNHMIKQIILLKFLGFDSDKKCYIYTYIVNPNKCLEYLQLSESQKLLILSKQIKRYSKKIDYTDAVLQQQIYIPLKKDQKIEPWSSLKLRRVNKDVTEQLQTEQLKKVLVQDESLVSDSSDLELKSKRSRKKVSTPKLKIDKDVVVTEELTDFIVKKKRKSPKKLTVNDVDSTISEAKDTKVPLKKSKKKASNESDSTVKTPIKGDQLGSLKSTTSNKSKHLKKQLDDSFDSISKQNLKIRAKKIKSQMNDQEDTSESETLSNVDALEQNPKKKSKVKGGVMRSENSSTKNKKKDKKKVAKKKVAKKKKKEENHSDSDDEE